MKHNHEIFKNIRDSRVILGLGVLAASVTLLAGCGDTKAEQSITPLSQLDVSTLSAEDAIQYLEVTKAIEAFRTRQQDPNKQLINGVNDLYSRYKDPLQDQTFGSGWKQDLTGWLGISSGNQQQVTEYIARDAVEEVVRERAKEIATVEGKPADAAAVVKRYIDNKGNVTEQEVLRELAGIEAQR